MARLPHINRLKVRLHSHWPKRNNCNLDPLHCQTVFRQRLFEGLEGRIKLANWGPAHGSGRIDQKKAGAPWLWVVREFSKRERCLFDIRRARPSKGALLSL